MIINSKIKNTSDAIDYLNRAVFGDDPETSVLTRVYEGVTPIQDRVTAVENSAALVDVQALKDKVDELSNLTEIFANLAYPMPNLVSNGDLTIPSSDPTIPQGFVYSGTIIQKSLNNGIVKFTPGSQFAGLARANNSLAVIGETYYTFAMVKSTSDKTILSLYSPASNTPHTGSGNYELLSAVNVKTNTDNRIDILTSLNSGWTQIEVDFIGSYNVSTMKLKGVKNDNGTPFTLLTNAQIKTQLDLWMQTRFPLDVLLMMRS